MKGAKLYVAILAPLAIGLGFYTALKNWAESWSQNHGTDKDYFLYSILLSIILTFWSAAEHHPGANREIVKFSKWSIRTRHMMRTTALLFCGVVIFGVNNHEILFSIFGGAITVSFLHMVFTGSAIASGYFMMLTYPESKRGITWAIIGVSAGALAFVLGYKFGLYTIGWGEVGAAAPFIFFFGITWILKKIKKD